MAKQVDFNAALKSKGGTPARVDPFDLAPVRARFEPYQKAIAEMASQAATYEVSDEPSLKAAVEMAGQAQTLNKKIEEQRKAIVEDPNRFVRSVNMFAKDFQGKLNLIVGGFKGKIGDYQHRREIERREAERKARKEAAKLQTALDAEAKEKGVEAPQVTTPVLPEPDRVTRTDVGTSAHVRKVWTFEITDPGTVPREYCSVDESKIRAAIKNGIRTIEGVRIFETSQAVLRT